MSVIAILLIGTIGSFIGRIGAKLAWWWMKPRLDKKDDQGGDKYGW